LLAQLNRGGVLGFFKKEKVVTDEMLKEIARYYFLLTGNNLRGIDEKSYGFSIQDYLDYMPDVIKERRKTTRNKDELNLQELRLNNLYGLKHIDNKDHLTRLWLNDNQLTQIASDEFEGLVNLKWLVLNRNRLTYLSPVTFVKLSNLETLLIGNRLSEENKKQITQALPAKVETDFGPGREKTINLLTGEVSMMERPE
jgi:Leucine-rich repeat (LRR) protein